MADQQILVTGSDGQLGNELRTLEPYFSDFQFTFTDYNSLDVTNAKAVSDILREQQFQWLINCAAYTAVDKAEEDREKAFAINSEAVEHLAKSAVAVGTRFIHISTDFVFDGAKASPYVEEDRPRPEGVYAASKREGEAWSLEYHPQSYVLRTSWLYSSFGNNFAKTMMRLGADRDELGVVYDQVGTPTYARDLAEVIVKIIRSEKPLEPGLYHFSNEGVASWYDFARAVMEFADLDCEVKPITTEEYPTPAKRPTYSVLHKGKIKEALNISIPYWRNSLQDCIELLKQEENGDRTDY